MISGIIKLELSVISWAEGRGGTPNVPPRKEKVSYRRTVSMRKFSRFDETRRAGWSRLIFSMCAWLSNRAIWVWQRVAFPELCLDFTPSVKVSIFIIEYLVAHQFSDFFLLKSYSAVLELFGIKELDLSWFVRHKSAKGIDRPDSNHIRNSLNTVFQNPVKNKKGANVK